MTAAPFARDPVQRCPQVVAGSCPWGRQLRPAQISARVSPRQL